MKLFFLFSAFAITLSGFDANACSGSMRATWRSGTSSGSATGYSQGYFPSVDLALRSANLDLVSKVPCLIDNKCGGTVEYTPSASCMKAPNNPPRLVRPPVGSR